MNKGLNELAMQDWEKAFYTFDTAVEFFPDSTDFYHNMGQVSDF